MSKGLYKASILFLVLSLVTLSLGACSGTTAAQPAGEPIIVGHLGLLSGAGAVAGRPILDGAKLAAQEINLAGGVLGRQLVLISRDTGGRPEEAVRLARELIQRDGAQFIQGPFTDAENMAVSQVGKELRTIVLPYVARPTRYWHRRTSTIHLPAVDQHEL
jgi:branched-chain amino acid transport system substrate-binding protein